MQENIKEKRLTKAQLAFIGTKFLTPRGATLVVTNVVGKQKDNRSVFGLTCSICSNDKELWPEGSIKSPSNSLVNGSIPCGCARAPKWTESQTKVRVIRECSKRGYIFKDWEGVYLANVEIA